MPLSIILSFCSRLYYHSSLFEHTFKQFQMLSVACLIHQSIQPFNILCYISIQIHKIKSSNPSQQPSQSANKIIKIAHLKNILPKIAVSTKTLSKIFPQKLYSQKKDYIKNWSLKRDVINMLDLFFIRFFFTRIFFIRLFFIRRNLYVVSNIFRHLFFFFDNVFTFF